MASSPPARSSTPTKQTEIFKSVSKLINDEIEKVSWWTTNALSAKTKRLAGCHDPA